MAHGSMNYGHYLVLFTAKQVTYLKDQSRIGQLFRELYTVQASGPLYTSYMLV